MAFGMFLPDFNDSFDTGKVVGTGAQAKARERANSFLDTARVGGSGVDIFKQMREKEIMDDANRAAQSTANNASLISGGLDLIGSVGSFGAAGGFGGAGAVGGDGGAAAGLTMPGSKGYDFFKNSSPLAGDFTYDFGGIASSMGY